MPDAPDEAAVEFVRMQTWRPGNGEDARQIQECRVAGIADHCHPPGTVLVCWAVHAGKWGVCSERSFKAWVRRTKARLI